jgi:hypothetical protein
VAVLARELATHDDGRRAQGERPIRPFEQRGRELRRAPARVAMARVAAQVLSDT